MTKKYHRAFGVYGVIGNQSELVVIKKNGGPYINRYDLPGGSLEDGESLSDAISREITEETGLVATSIEQLGTTSFKYPWLYERWTLNQHICVFYRVREASGNLQSAVPQFIGQDSLGAVRMPLQELSLANSSPLVLKAKEYLEHHEEFDVLDNVYHSWDVLNAPVF